MKKRSFRKTSVGKGVNRPRSQNMTGLKTQLPNIKKEILDERLKQSKIITQIKEDIKKIRESNISMTGLQELTPKSIEKLQDKRKKSLVDLISTVSDFNILLKNITKLETRYKKEKTIKENA